MADALTAYFQFLNDPKRKMRGPASESPADQASKQILNPGSDDFGDTIGGTSQGPIYPEYQNFGTPIEVAPAPAQKSNEVVIYPEKASRRPRSEIETAAEMQGRGIGELPKEAKEILSSQKEVAENKMMDVARRITEMFGEVRKPTFDDLKDDMNAKEGYSKEELVKMALLTTLPTIAGGLFGGLAGAAGASKAGPDALAGYVAGKKEDVKNRRQKASDEAKRRMDHSKMNHASMSEMDHSKMNHVAMSEMDHSKMNHSAMSEMDHSKMNHAAMSENTHTQHGMPSTEHKNAVVYGWANASTPAGHKALNYEDLKTLQLQPDTREPSSELVVRLGGTMERYIWTINGKKFSDATPLKVKYGERIRIKFINDSMMAHPMHLHGMFMQLENGQTAAEMPNKHTLIVPPGKTVTALLTADELGEWAIHCHLLYHMSAGMMNKLIVAQVSDNEPLSTTAIQATQTSSATAQKGAAHAQH